jgi:hypothetical protein
VAWLALLGCLGSLPFLTKKSFFKISGNEID